MKFVVLPAFLSLLLTLTAGGQGFFVDRDLHDDAWKFEDGKYQKVEDNESVRIAYFFIDPSEKAHEYLKVQANRPYSLFVNGQLAAVKQERGVYSLDSLRTRFASAKLQVAIHQDAYYTYDMIVQIGLLGPVRPLPGAEVRASSFFRDFVVVAVLLLLVLFIVLIRINPKLTSDYFSVNKVFSPRETDEAQLYSRITSATNILFYVFCSLMAGLCISIIFHFTSGFSFVEGNFWSAIYDWLRVSGLVLLIFFLKIMLVYSLSFLFGIRSVAGAHFLNWIRVLLISAGIFTVTLFFYFVMRGQSVGVYQTIAWIITIVMIMMMIFVFLKLIRRGECSIFHLFSYICATELIPFVITIKLLHQ